MLKSRNENFAYSYIMGIDKKIGEELNSINALYELEDGECYLANIPKINIERYEEIISKYLKPGFWNEYISDEVVFIFKTKENKIMRYKWNENTEKEILRLCNAYADLDMTSIKEMLLDVPFYKENSVYN